jgi:four helix bundle protein
MMNVAEGFARETDNEFIRSLWISKGSAGEVQSLSYAAFDQNYVKNNEFEAIYKQAEKVSKLDSGLIKYLVRCRSVRRKDAKTQ